MKLKGAASVIEAHGLAFRSSPADANPYMPQASDDMKHWFCTFSGPDVADFEFYVSFGEDFPDPPDPAAALSLVAEDVRSYRDCDGYGGFARMLGIDEADDSGRVAYDEIGRLASIIEALAEKTPSKAKSGAPETAPTG